MADLVEVIALTKKYLAQRAEIGDLQFLFDAKKEVTLLNSNIVGEGNSEVELVFLGSFDKEESSFVGKNKETLFKIVAAINLNSEDVYLISIKKGKQVSKEQLLEKLAVIKPKVVCVMDDFSLQLLLGVKKSIEQLRGNFLNLADFSVMPTFHPAYLLKIPKAKAAVWEDMQKVRDFLKA